MDYALLLILTIWFLLSMLAQFRGSTPLGRVVSSIKRRDLFAVIPAWSFFAPNPGMTDTEVLFRDCMVDGEYSPWIALGFERGKSTRVIWNPDKRFQKVINDMCSSVLRMAYQNTDNKQIMLSIPYLALLSYVSGLAPDAFAEYRQFTIVRAFGYHTDRQPTILFVSSQHRI